MLLALAASVLAAASPTAPPPAPPGWRRIFSDDFATPSATFPTAGWTAYPTSYKDTSGHGTYDCATVCSVAGGSLLLHLQGRRVAAPLPTLPRLREARYQLRFRVPSATPRSYKIAWLLWPDTPQGGATARDGEIDFPETDTLEGEISAHTHWKNPSGNGDQESFPSGVTTADWHTATIERTASMVRYVLDGRTIGTSTGARLPTTSMHWVLQSETRLDGPAPAPSAEALIEVDYATVDVPGGTASVPPPPSPPPPAPPVVPPPPAVDPAPPPAPPQPPSVAASSWCG